MLKRLLFIACLCATGLVNAQTLGELSVDKIMRDPKWIGTAPSNVRWSLDGKTIYFDWNPENATSDSLYKISLSDRKPQKVSKQERMNLPSGNGLFNKTYTQYLYEKNGDIYLHDIINARTRQITNTIIRESNPAFSGDERKIIFTSDQNLFSWEIASGNLTQLTDFKKGKRNTAPPLSEQEKWLKQDQLTFIQIIKERDEAQAEAARIRKSEQAKRPKEIYLDDKNVDQARLSPDGKFITFRLSKNSNAKTTIVPNYVTASGFTENIPTRTKVGANQNNTELFVYDIVRDTVLQVKTDGLPGINEKPLIAKEEPKDKKASVRAVSFFGPLWSDDGKQALLMLRAIDNKDRWITLLDVATQKLEVIHRLHDEAWVGGPGSFSMGWINNTSAWFVSEESGYAHLYSYDLLSKTQKALTSGKYEVQQVNLSRTRKHFYLTTNEVHPGEKHFYKLSVNGGTVERITAATGAYEVEVSPDEKMLAYRYSYSNKPWELFLSENKAGAKPQQITQSLTKEFTSYNWRDPTVTTVKARDGADIYTRLYKPAQPNGAAVIFVHGAGYLQNAHKWWSSYFREYMFHNLLADQGYTVIDIDYRASSGYGRDWRTGIYRQPFICKIIAHQFCKWFKK